MKDKCNHDILLDASVCGTHAGKPSKLKPMKLFLCLDCMKIINKKRQIVKIPKNYKGDGDGL